MNQKFLSKILKNYPVAPWEDAAHDYPNNDDQLSRVRERPSLDPLERYCLIGGNYEGDHEI